MARRLKAMGHPHYRNGFEVTLHEDALDLPLRWKRPSHLRQLDERPLPPGRAARFHQKGVRHDARSQLASLSDPDQARRATGRAQLELPWDSNIWQGVTVEHADYTDRIDLLRQTGAHIKFLSRAVAGPNTELKLRGINWVIVGGESGRAPARWPPSG
jgi:protein gp37